MKENYKITWSLILLNATCALMQMGFTWGHLNQGRWLAVFSILCVVLNSWVAWILWRGMTERRQREKDRVMGYLGGKIG
jgi:hypothetical protein